MERVNNFNLFGVEARQIPCMTGAGAPTTATEGAVGELYMNTLTGDVYKCTAVVDGVHTWNEVGNGGSSDAVMEELYATAVYADFETGSINSANGSDTDTASPRLRSGYMDKLGVYAIESIDTNYQIYVYFYDASMSFLGNTGGWVSRVEMAAAINNFPALAYVRLVVKRTDNTTITTAEVAGKIVVNRNRLTELEKYKPLNMMHMYLTGDVSQMTKDNAVPLDYVFCSATGKPYYSGTCTCKWQGSSSVRRGYPKRNYTIKLTDAIRVNGKWGYQKKYCLKANWIDPSAARNLVSANAWAEIVSSRDSAHESLKASPNYGAVNGYPVIVVINGEFTGLYTLNIPKDAWMFGMGNGEAEYIVAGESNGQDACGFMAEATFTGDEVAQTLDFSVEHAPDGVEDSIVINSFNTMIRAVINAPRSAEWENAVAPYIDVDSVIDYYIFTCCIGAYDNTRKNILYATYDGVKWFMSAYDLDATFGANVYGTADNGLSWYPVINDRTQFREATYMHKLFSLVYNHSKEKLKARYAELRGGVLSNEYMWELYNNFISQISRTAYNMDAEKWTTMPATSTANVSTYLEYYRMHCDYLDKEIAAL